LFPGYNNESAILPVSRVIVRVLNCLFQNNSVEIQSIGSTDDGDRSGFVQPEGNGNSTSDGGGDRNDSDGNRGQRGRRRSSMSQSEIFTVRGQEFNNRFLSGRGGGAALLFNSDQPADVVVWQTYFLENAVVEFGGGAFILLQGPTTHSVSIRQCRCVCVCACV